MSEPSNAGTPASEGLGKELDKAAAAPPAAAKAPPAKPTAAAPPKPPAAAAGAPPKKPAAPAKGKQTRRGFFSALTEPINVAWMAFAGSIGLSSLGLLRFMLPNVLAEPPSEFKIGPLDPFRAEPDTVNERGRTSSAYGLSTWRKRRNWSRSAPLAPILVACLAGCRLTVNSNAHVTVAVST